MAQLSDAAESSLRAHPNALLPNSTAHNRLNFSRRSKRYVPTVVNAGRTAKRWWNFSKTRVKKSEIPMVCPWFSEKTAERGIADAELAVREYLNEYRSLADTAQPWAGWLSRAVPELDARELSLDMLQEALQISQLGAVLVTHAFKPNTPSWAKCASYERRYPANNGHFPRPNRSIEATCAGRLKRGPTLTDFHIFQAEDDNQNATRRARRAAKGSAGYDGQGCRLSFNYNSMGKSVARLFEVVLRPPTTNMHPAITAALHKGTRPIYTVAKRAGGIAFHDHASTWFALTHGIKVWWLGPPSRSLSLAAVGNGPDAPTSPCSFLRRAPWSNFTCRSCRVVVQRAGQILFFGQEVGHATCALADAMGVGNQLGYWRSHYPNLSQTPSCTQYPYKGAYMRHCHA